MKIELPAAVPEIPVRDLYTALVCYESNFGFTIDWRDADLGLAGISRGDCRLFLASATYRKERGNTSPIVIWLNLNSRDEVNELYQHWTGSNAKLTSEPESKPWRLHEFTAEDLDGNILRVFYDFGTDERAAGDAG